MKDIFDYDGFLNRILTKIMYIVAVNLLFLICSLPVVTIGASCSAMYAVLFRYIQGDEPDIVKTYLRELKSCFWKATFIWLGMAAVSITLLFNCYTVHYIDGIGAEGIRILLNLVLVLLLALWVYVYPSISYYRNSVRGYLQFSIRAAIANLPATIAIILIQTIPLLVILFLAQYLSMAVLLLICCGFSAPAYLSGRLLLKIFKKYEGKEV